MYLLWRLPVTRRQMLVAKRSKIFRGFSPAISSIGLKPGFEGGEFFPHGLKAVAKLIFTGI